MILNPRPTPLQCRFITIFLDISTIREPDKGPGWSKGSMNRGGGSPTSHRRSPGPAPPGRGMFAPEVLEPTVERLAELAGDGRALEFAIGTGRVAVPLAERGVPVTGIELSPPMIDRLRTKVDEATIPVVVG